LRDDQRCGDHVQDAEPDERLRKHRVAACAHQQRAARDDRDVTPEVRKRRTVALREHQARARQQQERREDRCARGEPERVVLEVGARDAEIPQIEREVIGDHRADRDAAKGVDLRNPA